ncbi:dTDP-4-dehydrorhamnose reductase [Salinicola sp. MIT1003]|uniref:dTDP-4-dehydrorhamnose reductase n=1 Tax=Salinicola sp. MIT1003 TaxID=1882734 RepID=UPI0008DDE931|nr:dTDP-4-dehydrorhamnose reductase [Salinicola sp. MIT1003]OHZ01198.1 dTDP-4-dehydrorhamnose reductase [Salinicola sp. MIT1003]
MNIIVTGITGQVGFELQRSLAPFGRVLAPTREELDLTTPAAVADYLNDLSRSDQRPALIVNAAAYTAVDKAESEPELAQRLNAELPEQLARYCAKHDVPLVHYSSDYVYPGQGDTPWQETSPTGPLSVYGQTKLEGDSAIAESGAYHLIFRTSWVYSARGHNFMKTMLRLGRERDSLAVVSDQIGAPTPARLIAEITALAVARLTTQPLDAGIYHLAPRGETSWHGFAQAIFEQAAQRGEPLAIRPGNVQAIPTVDYPTPAQRPLNSRLDVSRLESALAIQLPDWRSQLGLTLDELLG